MFIFGEVLHGSKMRMSLVLITRQTSHPTTLSRRMTFYFQPPGDYAFQKLLKRPNPSNIITGSQQMNIVGAFVSNYIFEETAIKSIIRSFWMPITSQCNDIVITIYSKI